VTEVVRNDLTRITIASTRAKLKGERVTLLALTRAFPEQER
jgi:hypothetical protein